MNATASLLSTETLSFWEHFHNAGAWNKTHETGYFLHQTRLILAQERGDALWLAPFVPRAWLADGKEIAVDGLPTRFGKAGYRIRSSAGKGTIEATVRAPTRSAPREIVLRLRHPEGKRLRSVRVGGNPHDRFDPAREAIFIDPAPVEVSIRAEY